MKQFRKAWNLLTLVVFLTANFLNPISVVLAEDDLILEESESDASVMSEATDDEETITESENDEVASDDEESPEIPESENIDWATSVENWDIVGGGMNLII